MPGHYEDVPDTSARPRRRLGAWVVLALAVRLVLVAVLAGLAQRPSSPAPPDTAPPARVPPPGGGGLPRGSVAVGSGGSGAVYGVPVGFPSTPDGGVAAAVNWAAGRTNPTMLIDSQRHAIQQAIDAPDYQGPHVTDQAAAGLRRQIGVNESGQAVDSTGAVDFSTRPILRCVARYGAYRVENASPATTSVQVWMPCMFGVAHHDDLSGVQVAWTQARATVAQQDGQWRLTEYRPQPGAQKPADPSRAAVPLRERAALLPGWRVVANATDQPGLETS